MHTHSTHTIYNHMLSYSRSMEQHNQLLESSTVATMKSEIAQLEERMKREVKQQELHEDELAKLRARLSIFYC